MLAMSLVEWERQFEACKVNPALPRPNQAVFGRQLNAIKRIQFPWMLEVTKNAPQMAIRQLGRAFQNFFDKRARYPRFRRKGTHDRFTLHSRPLVCRYQYRHFRPHLPQAKNQGAVGVDFGVTHLVTLSTGEKVVGPKPLQTFLNRLRRLSRALSRKTKGPCNRSKAKTKLARLYARIANIRAKYRVKPAPAKQESSGKLSRLSFV